jgi:hypothetical protein
MVEPFIDPMTRRKLVLLPADEAAAVAILERDLGAGVRGTGGQRRAGRQREGRAARGQTKGQRAEEEADAAPPPRERPPAPAHVPPPSPAACHR